MMNLSLVPAGEIGPQYQSVGSDDICQELKGSRIMYIGIKPQFGKHLLKRAVLT
jgi:hypothetical protein